MDAEFRKAGIGAGFTEKQLEFLEGFVSLPGHDHTADQVIVDTTDGETLDMFIDEVVEAVFEGSTAEDGEEADGAEG